MLQISNIHFTSFKTDEKKYQTLFVDFANLSNFGINRTTPKYNKGVEIIETSHVAIVLVLFSAINFLKSQCQKNKPMGIVL
jgi:hypothetical protein